MAGGYNFTDGALSSAELYGPAATPTPTPTPGPCVEPPSGMVAWYPGDNNSNDIVGGNNGTLQGGTTFASGEVEQAFSFDGQAT